VCCHAPNVWLQCPLRPGCVRDQAVLNLPKTPVNLEEVPPDFMVVISLVCGIAGLLLKVRCREMLWVLAASWLLVGGCLTRRAPPSIGHAQNKLAAWLSLFACLGSLANIKTAELDIKQMMATVTFSVMSVVVNYFGRPKQ